MISVSWLTPSHWTSTSSYREAAHSAPRRTFSQKSKPRALGTTAISIGPCFSPASGLTSGCRAWQAVAKVSVLATKIRAISLRVMLPLSRGRSDAPATELVPVHGQPDDDAYDYLLVEEVDVEENASVADQGYQERPDEGAHNRPLPAEEARPADDDGGYHIELEPRTGIRLAREDPGGRDHAAQARQSPRYHVHQPNVAPDRDTRQARGLPVGADGVGIAAEPGSREDYMPGDGYQNERDYGDGDRVDLSLPEQSKRFFGRKDGLPLARNEGQTPGRAQHTQGRDERVQVGHRDQKPIY